MVKFFKEAAKEFSDDLEKIECEKKLRTFRSAGIFITGMSILLGVAGVAALGTAVIGFLTGTGAFAAAGIGFKVASIVVGTFALSVGTGTFFLGHAAVDTSHKKIQKIQGLKPKKEEKPDKVQNKSKSSSFTARISSGFFNKAATKTAANDTAPPSATDTPQRKIAPGG